MANSSEIIEKVSRFDFGETLRRLTNGIASSGMTVFARIDHSAAALAAGLSLPPTVVILYGNPKGGTPIMAAAPQAALDLPLRVLLRQRADGRVAIAWHPIAPILGEAGVEGALVSALASGQMKPFEGMCE